MPDDFDFSQLPKNETFKAMSLADKYGYLSHVSPTFQKMAPEDQQGYVQHLTGGPAPTAATISAEPDKKGFAGEAGTLLKNQAASLAGGPYAAYQAYTAARARGEGMGTSLTRAAIPLVPGATEAMGALDTITGYKDRRDAYTPAVGKTAASAYSAIAPLVAPQVGVDLPRMEDAASRGDTGAVVAGAAVPAAEAAASYGAKSAGDALPSRAEIGTALRTPRGTLTPRVRAASAIGGGAVGGTIGALGGSSVGPYGTMGGLTSGAMIGSKAGIRLANLLIPDRPPPELGTPENPGFMSKLPTTMPRPAVTRSGKSFTLTTERSIPTPASPIATQSPLSEFAERQAAAPIVSKSSSASPKLPAVNFIPEPRPEFRGETPNYMASIPRGRLPGLAAAGKPGAGTQLQRLGKTVLYTPPEGYPGPRVEESAGLPTSLSTERAVQPPVVSQAVKPNGKGLGLPSRVMDQFPSEKLKKPDLTVP